MRRQPCNLQRPRPTVPDTVSQIPNPEPQITRPLYACLYRPPIVGEPAAAAATLADIAEEFSPRYELHGCDLVSIDVSGLARLLGPAQTIGEELRREVAARGVRGHVAVACTRTAALILAIARPGLTVVARGEGAGALAPIQLGILERVDVSVVDVFVGADPCVGPGRTRGSAPARS